ncbi:MAG: type IV toxin-antitoxin system AbiEi family antitoxin domain-containing protein [Actinomycetota bacterium]
MSTALARVSAFSAKQYGLFTRAQARDSGLTDEQLRNLVLRGVLQRLNRRVFRFASSTRTWHQAVMAACLDGGPECVASHRTAAALHKFDGFSPGVVVEVLLPMNVRHRRRSVVVHHTRDLPARDRCRIGPIPATSAARTLALLGAVVPADTVEEAFDGAERDRIVTRADVIRRYTALRAPGRTGIGALTQVLAHRDRLERVPRSVLERRMMRLLERAGLPLPVSRFRVRLRDGSVIELDFAWVEFTLGIEVDGHRTHAARRARASDNVRANKLADVDWSLRRFTWEQVTHEPAYVAAAVHSALVCRGYRL